MELYPKPKTDEEYIECIRKHVTRSNWYSFFHFCVAMVCFGGFYAWARFILIDQIFLRYLQPEVQIGFAIGAITGTIAGFLIILAGQNVIWASRYLDGKRTEYLLVNLHDELKQYKQNPLESHQTKQ